MQWFCRFTATEKWNKTRRFLGSSGLSDTLGTQQRSTWLSLARTNNQRRRGPIAFTCQSNVEYTLKWHVHEPMRRPDPPPWGLRSRLIWLARTHGYERKQCRHNSCKLYYIILIVMSVCKRLLKIRTVIVIVFKGILQKHNCKLTCSFTNI